MFEAALSVRGIHVRPAGGRTYAQVKEEGEILDYFHRISYIIRARKFHGERKCHHDEQ